MQITSNFTHPKVQFDQETETHLVVEVTAPALEQSEKRSRLCIMPLVDVSGSMSGLKLEYAKKSLIKLIDHLSPEDYCGLLSFTDTVTVLSEPKLCTSDFKTSLKRLVEGLEALYGTNIADALLEGYKVVNRMDLNASVISRVILFTDGAANVGSVTSSKDLLKLSQANQGIASASAFGYGSDVEQEFLLSLAKQSQGNYAFVQNPDDALAAFGKELGGLLSTYASNLTIEVSPKGGHAITKVVSDVDAEEGDLGEVTIKIPDILAEETRHIVLAVKTSGQKKAGPRAVNVVDVKLGYDVLDSNLKRKREAGSCTGKIQFVKEGDQTTAISEDLSKIVGLAEIVRAQLEAEELAEAGNYSAAASRMSSVSTSLRRRGLAALGNTADNIGCSVNSAGAYRGSSSYRASFSRGVTRGVGGTYDAAASRELASYGVSLSTSTQDQVSHLFTSDDSTGGADPNTVGTSWTSNEILIPDPGEAYPPLIIPTGVLIPEIPEDASEEIEPEEVRLGRKADAIRRKIKQSRSKKSWR